MIGAWLKCNSVKIYSQRITWYIDKAEAKFILKYKNLVLRIIHFSAYSISGGSKLSWLVELTRKAGIAEQSCTKIHD